MLPARPSAHPIRTHLAFLSRLPPLLSLLPLGAALLAGSLPAAAQPQGMGSAPVPAACPAAADVTQALLLGLWRAEFDGTGHAGTLLLEPHREYTGSLSGALNRGGTRLPVAGDIEDGAFTLEESADGRRISATWLGDVVEGSCGREIRGTWQAEGASTANRFVLRKQ